MGTGRFQRMTERARGEFPNFKVIATTLRTEHSATSNDWGALLRRRQHPYGHLPSRAGDPRPGGRRRQLRLGLYLRADGFGRRKPGLGVRFGPRCPGHDHPGRRYHGVPDRRRGTRARGQRPSRAVTESTNRIAGRIKAENVCSDPSHYHRSPVCRLHPGFWRRRGAQRGVVISEGTTARSNSSSVMSPSAVTASTRVVPSS